MDTGSYQIKAGLNDEEWPRFLKESLKGKLKGKTVLPNNIPKDCLGLGVCKSIYNY